MAFTGNHILKRNVILELSAILLQRSRKSTFITIDAFRELMIHTKLEELENCQTSAPQADVYQLYCRRKVARADQRLNLDVNYIVHIVNEIVCDVWYICGNILCRHDISS